MDVLIPTLLVNISFILFILISFFVIRKQKAKASTFFKVGLLIILAANIVAIPATVFIIPLLSNESGIFIVSNVIGLLSGLGIFLMTRAFKDVHERI